MDLKPANIVIPGDGRPRVVDFGLAITTDAHHPASGSASGPASGPEGTSPDDDRRRWGTPAYTAPERWRGEPATAACDVWALGVILFELCADRLPFEGETMEEGRTAICSPVLAPRLDDLANVPMPLADIVARCLAKDPSHRPSAAEVHEDLERLLGERRSLESAEDSPFRGLQPFDQRHAHLFFGREAEVSAFVERLRQRPVLAVVGPTGAGKNSFVHAGVVPRLREQQPWIVLQLRPGAKPFATLADRLRRRETQTYARSGEIVSDSSPSHSDAARAIKRSGEISGRHESILGVPGSRNFARELFAAPRALSLALRAIAEEEQCKVLLVVDQLEELFTMVDHEDVRARFMQAICTAADDADDPVRVIFTVRDDFLGRLSIGPEAREALAHVTVVQSLGQAALEDVLRRPVEAVGYRWEDPELVREMAASVAGEPASLPLLQFAGQSLWERRDEGRRVLLRSVYEQMGGVEGALARHADGVLDRLQPAQRRLARELLLLLVTPERTRKVVTLSSLRASLPESAGSVISELTESRLLSVSRVRDAAEPGPRVELAHESLIRTWATLARWLDESREEMAFLADATLAAELWEKRGRRPEELWQDDALHDAERTLARVGTELPPAVERFMAACHRRQNRRARRRRILLGSGVAVLLVVTLTAVAVAIFVAEKEREARRERNEANAQREAAQAQEALARQQRAVAQREGARAALGNGRVLEARAKLRMALEHQDGAAARALWWTLGTEPTLWRAEIATFGVAVAFSPDGSTVASGCQDAALCLLDVDTRAATVLRGHREKVSTVAFSHDGKRIAAGDWGSEIIIWNVQTGQPERSLSGHDDRVLALAFSPDDSVLASAGRDRTIRLWDPETGRARKVLHGHSGGIEGLDFSHDGTRLASGSEDETVRTWEVGSGRLVQTLEGHDAAVEDVAFGPRGENLASAGNDGTIRIWDARSGELVRVLEGHTGGVRGVSFSPDARRLASGAYDGTVRLWNVASGECEQVLLGHDASVRDVAFSPDGHALISTSYDETLRLWNVDALASPKIEEGHAGAVRGVDLSPDGSLVASGGFDRTVRLWDVATGEPTAVLRGHEGAIYGVEFSPDGRLLASAGSEGEVRLWNVQTGKTEHVLQGHGAAAYAVAFSPDGRRVASASRDRTVRIWDVESGAALRTLTGLEHIIWDVRFDHTGRRVAAASWDRTVLVWDASTGALVRRLAGHEGAAYGVDFDPSGRHVVSAAADGTIRLWEIATGDSRIVATATARLHVVRFDPSGKSIAAALSDGTVRMWSLDGEETTVLDGHADEATVIDFSRDGERIATVGDDGTVRVWDMPSARPHWKAPVLLREPPRLYSHRGWIAIDGTTRTEPDAAWRRVVEADARLADESADGKTLCVQTFDDHVQRWDRSADELREDTARAGLRRVLAFRDGCLVQTDEGISLLGPSGEAALHSGPSTAIATSDDAVLVAAGGRVLVFGTDGKMSSEIAVGIGVSAVAKNGDYVVVGYRDGTVAAFAGSESAPPPPDSFEQVPSGEVTRLVTGPMNTVIAGYATGTLAMWSLDDGTRLAGARLHGPVAHLVLHEHRLYAATALGRMLAWDVGVFFRNYCGLMREVWAQVPVVWENGRAVRREAPADHACR